MSRISKPEEGRSGFWFLVSNGDGFGIAVAWFRAMAEPEEDRVSKKVVYEQVSSSSGGNNTWMLIVIAVIVIALVGYVLLHLH